MSFILSIQVSGNRPPESGDISRLLLISKGVVSNSLKELTRLNLLEELKIPENLIFKYFTDLVDQIQSGKKNKFYKLKKEKEKNDRIYAGTFTPSNYDYDTL